MHELKNHRKSEISNIILHLINHIARNYKNINVHYDEITEQDLEYYNIEGKYLKNIIEADIFMPAWINTETHKKI